MLVGEYRDLAAALWGQVREHAADLLKEVAPRVHVLLLCVVRVCEAATTWRVRGARQAERKAVQDAQSPCSPIARMPSTSTSPSSPHSASRIELQSLTPYLLAMAMPMGRSAGAVGSREGKPPG